MSEITEKKRKSKLFRMHWADWVIYIFLALFAVITFYLLWYVIIGAFSNGQMYASGGVFLIPKGFTFANFEVIFQDSEFWTSFRNTVFRTAVGIVAELLFTALVAYAMTSKHLRCKRAYYWIFIFTMFFSGGIVPMYLLLRILGLYDTFWVYILPSIFSVYNMIIISNFYKGIPESLYEAAELDGAGELRIWALIYMPLSKPVLATVALWIAVDHWNSYMGTMLYTQAGEWTITLQYYLKQLINEASGVGAGSEYSDVVTARTISYAGIIVALIPIMSGMCFDMTAGMMGFNPVKTDAAKQFRSVWFLGDAWGNVSIGKQGTAIKVISGSMTLKTLRLPYMSSVSELVIDGKKTEFTFENGTLSFPAAKVEKEIVIK